MAKQPVRILTEKDDTIDLGSSIPFTLPMAEIVAGMAQGGEPTAQGINVWDVRIPFKLAHVKNADGAALGFVVSFKVTRDAATQDESEAIDRTADLQATRRDTKKATERADREAEINRTAKLVKDTILENNAQRGDLAKQINDSLKIAQAVNTLAQGVRALPSAE